MAKLVPIKAPIHITKANPSIMLILYVINCLSTSDLILC